MNSPLFPKLNLGALEGSASSLSDIESSGTDSVRLDNSVELGGPVGTGGAEIFQQPETDHQQPGGVILKRMTALANFSIKPDVAPAGERAMKEYVRDGEQIFQEIEKTGEIPIDKANKHGASAIVWYLQAKSAGMKNLRKPDRQGEADPGSHFVKGSFHLVGPMAPMVVKFLKACGAGAAKEYIDNKIVHDLMEKGMSREEANIALKEMKKDADVSAVYERLSSHFNDRIKEGTAQFGIDFLPGDSSMGGTEEKLPCGLVTILFGELDEIIEGLPEMFIKAEDQSFALGAIMKGETHLLSGAQIKSSVLHSLNMLDKMVNGQVGEVAGTKGRREDGDEVKEMAALYQTIVKKHSTLKQPEGALSKLAKLIPGKKKENRENDLAIIERNMSIVKFGSVDGESLKKDNRQEQKLRSELRAGNYQEFFAIGTDPSGMGVDKYHGGAAGMEDALDILQEEGFLKTDSKSKDAIASFYKAAVQFHTEEGHCGQIAEVARSGEVCLDPRPSVNPQDSTPKDQPSKQAQANGLSTPRGKPAFLKKV